MSKISDLINKETEKTEREFAKKRILELIDIYALKGPEGYGVTFEGMTCARWQPWADSELLKSFNTALSPDRLYMLWQYANAAPPGDFYEFGVYNGGVTEMLSNMCMGTVHAYDTFSGLAGAGEHDLMDDGEYESNPFVLAKLNAIKNVTLYAGDVRKTFTKYTQMSFAHIDLDLYEPTAHVLPIAYHSLVPGGFIICDDYGLWMTPGVKKAVDEFIDSLGNVKYIYLPTGQMVIMK